MAFLRTWKVHFEMPTFYLGTELGSLSDQKLGLEISKEVFISCRISLQPVSKFEIIVYRYNNIVFLQTGKSKNLDFYFFVSKNVLLKFLKDKDKKLKIMILNIVFRRFNTINGIFNMT